MTTAAHQRTDNQPAKRTFGEMIAHLQAGHKAHAKPAPHLKAVPAVQAEQPSPIALPNTIQLKALDLERRQNLLLGHVNRTMPTGCHVLAWSILPKDVFQSELGRFLMIGYDFHAHGPENTLLLPATANGAQFLKLPRHPLVTVQAHVADAFERVNALRETVTADHHRTVQAMQSGDISQLYRSSERHSRYRQQLSDIACDIAETAFGENIWEAHESRFRKLIQSL